MKRSGFIRAAVFTALIVVLLITHFSKGKYLDWERRPVWEGSAHSSALVIQESGSGYWGGYLFNREEEFNLNDFRQRIAVHKAVIKKTGDDWKTRSVEFEAPGEIEGFYRTGAQIIIAKITHVSPEALVETARFIGWDGSEWKEISSLPYRVVKVWDSEGPAVLAVGYPQEGYDPLYASLSLDGGHKWDPVSLSAVNVAEDSLKFRTVLFPDGRLYCASPTGLSRLDLAALQDTTGWQRVRPYPPSFKPMAMARRDQGLFVFGSLPEKGFAIWYTRADGSGMDTLSRCQGIPEDFLALSLRDVDGQLYLVGRVRYLVNGEMRGFDHFILKSSTPAGIHWENMRLPITGSLNAVDFGKNGRIWAVAAGNRLQIFKPAAPRL